MELTGPVFSSVAGILCGILSGFGIGGGSLLMVWMTAAAGMEQKLAQSINLIYFLPTAAGSLIFHIKNKRIRWDAAIPAAICGCITAALSSLVASNFPIDLLRKLFGGFLLIIGIIEFRKKAPGKQET